MRLSKSLRSCRGTIPWSKKGWGCSKDLINKAEAQLSRVRSSADTGSSERKRIQQRSSQEWYAGHSFAYSGVTAVSPMYTNERRPSDAVQRCKKIRTSVHERVRRLVQRQDSRERVVSGSRRNGATSAPSTREREQYGSTRCVARWLRVTKRGQKGRQLQKWRHSEENLSRKKDWSANLKIVGMATRVHVRERVITTREGKWRATVTRDTHVAESTHEAISVRETRRQGETRGSMTTQRCRTTQRITPWRGPHCGVGDHWRTAVAKYPTDQTEKQATISDMLLLSRVRGRDENSHEMRWTQSVNGETKRWACERETHPHKQQTMLLWTTVRRSPSSYREPVTTKWRKLSSGVGGARGEPRSSKPPQGRAGGPTPEDREQRQHRSQKSQWWKEVNGKRQSQIAEMEHRGRRTWTTTSRWSTRISLSGTKRQKSRANSRREEHA